ncbi:MAG: VOC family protein [Gammaproteobacteria bacterium]|nr:VOC family protein [Gammaproteobacteria bacterium]
MKVMVIVKASTGSEAGQLPSAELLDAMGRFNEELVAAGIMQSGDGLKPSSAGLRVRFSGAKRTVTSGPFAETNELIAGYWVWNVASMDEAVAWVKRCPNPMTEDSDIEIRPFYAAKDFAEVEGSTEALEREQELITTLALRQAKVNNYLFFSGRCEEALDYYCRHLGARIELLFRFGDSPEPIPEGAIPPDFDNKVMHAEFTLGDTRLFASDGCSINGPVGGFSLALTLTVEEAVRRAFTALADGGSIVMPLEPTFWSPLYGQVNDRFGISWMVMMPGQSPTD